MRKTIIFIIIFSGSFNLGAQSTDHVSYLDIIRNLVSDSTSVFYYPKLLQKVNESPNELTPFDIEYLYYGQVFNIGYTSRQLDDNDRIKLERFMSNGKKKKVIELGIEVLKKYPVDLTTLLYVSECLKANNLPDTTYFIDKRFKLLLNCILSTGNGKSETTAIKVVEIWDEKIIKGVLGYFGGREILSQNHGDDGIIFYYETSNGNIYFEEVFDIKFKK
jgi:Domain of unknown function (DUF4919)